MYGQFPNIEAHLAEMMGFVTGLALDYEAGRVGQLDLEEKVLAFFSDDVLDRLEAVAPGWRRMSAYAGGRTLVHVMSAFMALITCPEYQQAPAEQQALLKWIVLYHDVAKEIVEGQRDALHGFRSAAMAGAAVVKVGFPVAGADHSQLEAWAAFTHDAVTWSDRANAYIQDNSKLSQIMDGIGRIFGHQSAAGLVVKTVLLHMSLNVVADWPQTASLTEAESRQYIDGNLLPLLKVMMLVDNDAWALFDRPTKERYRQETLAVFEGMEKALD
jgi:hypothetical protein